MAISLKHVDYSGLKNLFGFFEDEIKTANELLDFVISVDWDEDDYNYLIECLAKGYNDQSEVFCAAYDFWEYDSEDFIGPKSETPIVFEDNDEWIPF